MTDCPRCGYHDPFHTSWFDVEKEVADPLYFKEWDLEIWGALQENPWVQVGEEIMYHRTPRSIERWKIAVLVVRKGGRIELGPRPLNKAGLMLGSRLAPKLTKWMESRSKRRRISNE